MNMRNTVISIGAAGLLVVGAHLVSGRKSAPFEALTAPENEILATSPELHAGAERLQHYAVLDKALVDGIVLQCVHLARHATQPPTLGNVRNVDNTSLRIAIRLRALRTRVRGQSANHSEVVREFDEVAQALKDACESQSFNMHQRLSSF